MILGISASGRTEGITSETVKTVLEATGLEYDYVSLSGKRISGCIGCTLCASDCICKVKDDWNAIGEKMLAADAVVFGAPNYFGTINALGHACLERTFSFRHQDRFRLAGKLGIVVSVDYKGGMEVASFVQSIMNHNKMVVVDTLLARGYSQCYTCGYGTGCASGNVVKNHGFIETLQPEHLPKRLSEQEQASLQAKKAGMILGSILRNR